ncbi:AraC family transcriptional regulator [Fulvivirga sediminis]|uniref:AraC family transcriptional regulator n=1 Tax=Fulvivirga sediminis TaxID=2803949 RepID=A0A937K178_9BACT|nr:AraC family transcriptional regulator [Fulvivirga sediminis]MBL3658329.1 AraC family transcriptional regulator [Fulvivirga sediminis]
MEKYTISSSPTRKKSSLTTLIENKSAYTFDRCELNFFETHQYAENVSLAFDSFALTSMLKGKKVMTLPHQPSFDYLPGESVILPPGEVMNINFPEARLDNPTQCLALTISDEMIKKTLDKLCEYFPKADTWGQWQIDYSSFHLTNTQELADTINRIVSITKKEKGKIKEMMIELTLQEMLVRLMQTQARMLFEYSYKQLSSSNSLAAAIEYIKLNLRDKIKLDQVAKKACMSRASFFKKFKETMGETPNHFILKERIKLAKAALKNSNKNITEVCYASGFENLSHFIRTFKQEVGSSPKHWQMSTLSASS